SSFNYELVVRRSKAARRDAGGGFGFGLDRSPPSENANETEPALYPRRRARRGGDRPRHLCLARRDQAVRRRDQARRIRHLDRGELRRREGLGTFCLFTPFRPCGPCGRTL